MIRARVADEVLDPLLHLGGGLVGEGDRQDRAGVGLALGDQPGDAAGEHPGLARAGAGDDQQRRPGVDDGGALGVVEPASSSSAAGPRRVVRGSAGVDVVEAGDREGVLIVAANPTGPPSRRPAPAITGACGQAWVGDQKTATATLATVSASRP